MLKIEKVAMNGLEGVELLEEVSLEMEKQAKLGNEKEVDRLGAMADKLGHALKEANIYKAFKVYKGALDDMLALRDLEDKLRDFEQKMAEADRDYRGAKAVLQSKTIYVV